MIIGLIAVLLMMMAFLVYRNNILSTQAATADARVAEQVAALTNELEQQLRYALRDLELARGQLEELEATDAAFIQNIPVSEEAAEYPYGEPSAYEYAMAQEYQPYQPYQPEPPYQPAPPPPAPPPPVSRTHVVSQGDNLSSISRQFYGNASYANIQRIMAANNITDPYALPIGLRLVIP
jgi:nucleoid-associated protein YgaU